MCVDTICSQKPPKTTKNCNIDYHQYTQSLPSGNLKKEKVFIYYTLTVANPDSV